MQQHEQADSQLIERLQRGDESAFDELMQRYKRPVINFVYRMLGSAAEADDVAQEVFVRVCQRIGDYEPKSKFSTWLFALARNAAIDRLRWRARHPAEPLDSAQHVAAGGTAADETSAREIGELIAAAVAALPEDQRTAIVLSEYHGQDDAEIAAIMNCSVKSVESRLYRAKHTLRKKLKHLLA